MKRLIINADVDVEAMKKEADFKVKGSELIFESEKKLTNEHREIIFNLIEKHRIKKEEIDQDKLINILKIKNIISDRSEIMKVVS